MQYKFGHAIIGGTFDHLHRGHEFFIDNAFEDSKKITIGLSKKTLVKDKMLRNAIQSYEERKKNLENYLFKKGFDKRSKVIPITDFYGNSLSEKNIDAIFSDVKNSQKINLINEKRRRMGFDEITVINVPIIQDAGGVEISSTRIRKGEIDEYGNSYINLFKGKNFKLPQELRESLRKPFGEILNEIDKAEFQDSSLIIAVGDIVVSDLMRKSIFPDISLYDFHTKKNKITDSKVLSYLPKADTKLINKAGTISGDVVEAIEEGIIKSIDNSKKTAIQIVGEEDLLAIPAILLAPLASFVVYGLRDRGAVMVEVTLELKEKIIEQYLSKFEAII